MNSVNWATASAQRPRHVSNQDPIAEFAAGFVRRQNRHNSPLCGWNRLRHCRAWCRDNESALPKPLMENLQAQFGSASTMSTFPLTGPVGGLTLLRER